MTKINTKNSLNSQAFYIDKPRKFDYFLIMATNSSLHRFAEVVFPVPVDHGFTYRIPERFVDAISPGMRVLVPFGARKTTGFVVQLMDQSDRQDVKDIDEVLDPVPLFSVEVLKLAKWIADYYLCGWGEVLKAALPAGIHKNSVKIVRLTHNDPERLAELLQNKAPRQAEIIRALAKQNPMPQARLIKQLDNPAIYSSLTKLRQAGFVRLELMLPRPKVGDKYQTLLTIAPQYGFDELMTMADAARKTAPKQAALLEFLCRHLDAEFTRSELARKVGVSLGIVKSLEARGILQPHSSIVLRDYYGELEVGPPEKLILNPDQQAALEAIEAALQSHRFTPMVLFGVTASGKTQVYIEAIAKVLGEGGSAVVLVPEIALTPQMVRRFRAHFGKSVAVFHSRMSPGERYDSWRSTWEGKHRIVIGPRSAIFAPLANVRLIIVDEEHEPSYKQEDLTPRYHARDVAVMRAKLNNAVVVLGSATPAVETFFNAQTKKYQLLTLPNRIDDVPMPEIHIVDMRREPRIIGRKEPIIFSRLLRQKIDEKLARGEQVILFQNRRGFATLLKCKSCDYFAQCEHCDISLTYHLRGHLLKCHYCSYVRKAPDVCPQCGGRDIFFRGIGTQRIEEEMRALFPGVKAVRMDLDTTRGKWAHDKILTQFGRGDFQILLGTQMVAKGLDFPRVTLVGVISADSELLFPDFRAGERTFQLLTQVAGRAGRKDRSGEVIIQTYQPDHYSLFFVKSHDYINFFRKELRDRRGPGYPPISRMINILFRGEDENRVQKLAEEIARLIQPHAKLFRMLGPTPALLKRIENNYRYQIVLLSPKKDDAGGLAMKNAIRQAFAIYREKNRIYKVQVVIDVDPMSIL